MKLLRGYVYVRVEKTTRDEWNILETVCNFSRTVYVRGRPRTMRYSLLDPTTRLFPAGMLQDAVQTIEGMTGRKVEVIDGRRKPTVVPSNIPSYLRDYQHEAVLACLEHHNGIIKMATGAGKTEVFVALTQAVPERWVFLVHRATLAHQAAKRVEQRTGEQVGVATEGNVPDTRIICGTYQTLYRALTSDKVHQAKLILQRARGVVCDEVHTVPAKTFLHVVGEAKKAYFRIGLSATPFGRSDQMNKVVKGYLGPILYEVTAKHLADQGRLILPNVRIVDVTQTSIAAGHDWNRGRAYQSVYKRAVVRSVLRNAHVAAAVKVALKPCLVFVKQVQHAREIGRLLNKLGITYEVAIGATAEKRREEIIKKLDYGELDVCITTPVFQEGVDIPGLRSIVVASGDKSTIAVMQRAGRAMRVAEGKDQCEIWDFRDIGVPWISNHAEKRIKEYERAKYPLTDESKNPKLISALSEVLG